MLTPTQNALLFSLNHLLFIAFYYFLSDQIRCLVNRIWFYILFIGNVAVCTDRAYESAI